MKKIKFAIVGCGRISEIHIPAILSAKGAILQAICDIDEAAAKQAAKNGGLEKYYLNLEEMLENEEIDVLNVCTPSGMHHVHTIMAAKYKVNVLCEKPLDITKENMDAMIKACHDEGVILGGIFQRRNANGISIAKKIIEEGGLGKIILAGASLKYYRSHEYYKSADWRGTYEYDGGGCLMNQGIHGIDLLMYLAGDIDSVTAKCITRDRDIEVEDVAAVIVKFKNGAIGIIEGSTSVFPGQDTVISLNGNEGSICLGDKGFYIWQPKDAMEKPEVEKGDFGGKNCGWSGLMLHKIQIEDMAHSVLYNNPPPDNRRRS